MSLFPHIIMIMKKIISKNDFRSNVYFWNKLQRRGLSLSLWNIFFSPIIFHFSSSSLLLFPFSFSLFLYSIQLGNSMMVARNPIETEFQTGNETHFSLSLLRLSTSYQFMWCNCLVMRIFMLEKGFNSLLKLRFSRRNRSYLRGSSLLGLGLLVRSPSLHCHFQFN